VAQAARHADNIGADVRGAAREAQRHVENAALKARPGIVILARAGYAAKGVVYLIVGFFAFTAAYRGGKAMGSKDALRSMLAEPYGRALLAVVAVGLAGYAVWCFVRALLDPEHEGHGLKGVAKRAFVAAKGVVHLSLVVAVVGMIMGSAQSDSGETGVNKWTAKLMAAPFGVWLVGLAGTSVVAYGLYQVYRAWVIKLDDQLNLGRMGPAGRTWTIRVARFGMAARGVVFAVVGVFLIQAAIHAAPGEARGLGEALRAVQQQSYGPWLLGAVALGLVAYGLYELARAKYRRIEPV
jgi:Domain of Unknown Function (DUF1206)